MSYRPHGRASVDPNFPQAFGVCDRCGALYNHNQLRWQYDWRGPTIQNLRVLICESCQDQMQQNGQRTFILPADPVPIKNVRAEPYVVDSNPLSGLGANPQQSQWDFSNQIGTMVFGGGVPAAFDGSANKRAYRCASITVSDSSFANYVGIGWSGNPNATNLPSDMQAPVLAHTLSSYTIVGPNDQAIGSTSYVVQGSQVGGPYAAWSTLSSGSIVGDIGEIIFGTPGGSSQGGRFRFHRVAFLGNGTDPIYVAQVYFSVSDGSSI